MTLPRVTQLPDGYYKRVDPATSDLIRDAEAFDLALARTASAIPPTFGAGGLFEPITHSVAVAPPGRLAVSPVAQLNDAVYQGICESLVCLGERTRAKHPPAFNPFEHDIARAGLSILVDINGAMILGAMRLPFCTFAQVDELGIRYDVAAYVEPRTYILYRHAGKNVASRDREGATGHTRCLGMRLAMTWVQALASAIESSPPAWMERCPEAGNEAVLTALSRVLHAGISAPGGLIFETAMRMAGARPAGDRSCSAAGRRTREADDAPS